MTAVLQLSHRLEALPALVLLKDFNVRNYSGDADVAGWLELRHRALRASALECANGLRAIFAENSSIAGGGSPSACGWLKRRAQQWTEMADKSSVR